MVRSLLRAVVIAATLTAALPVSVFAASVDLSILSMNGNPDPITLGTGNVTYTVSTYNSSGTAGTNVVLTNTLPASSTFVSATPGSGATCSQSGSTVTCTWPSLGAGVASSTTIVVTPTAGGALTLSSSVTGAEADPNTVNNSASKSVIVNSQIDLAFSSITATPDPITLGNGNVQYLVQYTNNSTSQATNVVLTNTLPASSSFVSATTPVGSGTCTQSGGTATCNWASIGAGTTYYAYITVTPTAGGAMTLSSSISATQPDPNTVNNSTTKSVTVNSQIDLAISSMTVSPDPVTLGAGTVQFLVQYTNNSSSPGTTAVLTSTLPTNSTFVTATTPVGSGSCTQSGGTVTCTWPSIGAGTTYYAYITVTPTAGGALTLSSTVSAAQPDSNTANNSGSKAAWVNAQIDLGISSMTVSPDPMTLGTGNVQFLVQYNNLSTSQATNAVLTSTIPAGSTFVSATTPVGSGTCSQSAGTVTCTWASIGSGSTYYAYITVTPTAAGALTLSSSVTANEPDPNSANNSGSKSVTVNGQIDLGFSSLSVTPDPVTLGTGNVQYLVQYYNYSSSQATNAVLTSTLPTNSTFVTATTPVGSGTCTQSAGTVTCTWASVPSNSTYYAYITVTPTAAGSLSLVSTLSAAQSDPNTSNNTATKSATVNSQIDLAISSMSVTPDPTTLGAGNVQFLVQYINNSSSQATGIVLTSTLPTSSTFVSATSPVGSGTCSQSAGTVTCNWASVGSGTTYYAYITVTPTANGALTLSSTVSGSQTDPNTSNNSASKAVTVGTPSGVDLRVSSISATPDPITLNTGNVSYNVTVNNISSTTGTNVVLTNTLPTNSTYVSSAANASGTCTPSGSIVTCNWASIPTLNSYTATIVVTPTSGGALTLSSSVSATEADPNPANNSDNKSVTVNAQIDLRVSSMSGTPDPITLGTGNVTFTSTVYNPGTSQATNVVLSNTLPTNSTYVSASASGSGSCAQAGSTVTCSWPSIAAFNSNTATIVVTPTAGGSLTLSSSVSATEGDPNTADNSSSKSTTVNGQIDLRISGVSATPDPITLGAGNVTYTATVYNASTSPATSVVQTSTLPTNSTFVSASANASGTCSQSAGTVTCNWTSLPAFNNYSSTIVVTPTSGGALTLSSSVSAAQSDPNTADNSGSKSVTVNGQIDLRISAVTANPDPVTLGAGNVSYGVTVYNASTTQATNVVLTNTLPTNSTYVSSSANAGGTCTPSGSTVTCTWTSIPGFNNYTATIVVTPTAGGALTLSANVIATEADPNTADNSGSKSVTVNAQIDLRVNTISGTPDPVTLGTGDVTYSVSVSNASSSQATSVVLTNTLPTNSTYVSSSANASGTCTQSGATVTCSWASIPASSTYSATIVVTPTAGGALTLSSNVAAAQGDPNTADNSGNKSVTVNAQIDLRISSMSATPDPLTLGTGNITYSVGVYNSSTSQATSVVLTNTLPTNATYVSSTANGGGTCSPSGSTVTCTWASLAAFNNFTATIIVTPTAGGPTTLLSSVAASQGDPNAADNSSNKSATVNAQIDLRISSVSGSPDPITFGAGNVTFSVSVFNASSSQATSVVLTNTLPSNSNFSSASANAGGTCTQSGGTVTCNWASIPASNTYTATIIVTPTTPGSLTLNASVAGAQPDPNTADNTSSKATTVATSACTTIPSGAVAWYRAESNGVDSTGPNFATANGGATYTTGRVGQAFSLNGTSAYVSAPDNGTLRPTDVTVETWVYFTSIPSTGVIVSKTAGSVANDSYLLWYQGGALHGAVGSPSGPGTIVDYTWTPALNTWYHVAFTSDATAQAETLYVNGAVVGTATNTTAIGYDTNPLLIGAEIENSITQYFFPGRIDEVTLYNRALSQSEVQAVYGAGTFGKCYVAPSAPSISSFSPTSANAGASVVISGSNFTSVSAVKFNGTAATFTGDSASQITAIVPAGATTGTISVLTGGGTATSATSFTASASAHWINSSGGNWNTASNWSTGIVPASSDSAYIDASGTYTVTINANTTVGSVTVGGGATGVQTLSLPANTFVLNGGASSVTSTGVFNVSGGTLNGGPLTVNGTMNWTGGYIDGAGTANIASGGILNINASGAQHLSGGYTINNSGVTHWTGGTLILDNGSLFNNQAPGLFSVECDCNLAQDSGSGTLSNAGTFRKTTATGATIGSTGVPFNNSGTIDIVTGTFESGLLTLNSGTVITGTGFRVNSGTVTVAGAASVASGQSMNITGGTLTGTAGSALTVNGTVNWTGGFLDGANGTMTIPSGGVLNINASGSQHLSGGYTINNSGVTHWTGGTLILDNGSLFNNQASGLFSVECDCTFAQDFGSGTLSNAGTFRKTIATGATIGTIGVPFNNSGTIDILSGTFESGLLTLNNGTIIKGTGFRVSSGTVTVAGAASVASGQSMNITGGNLTGTAGSALTVNGTVNWTSGFLDGASGTMNIASGGVLNINASGSQHLSGGYTINNSGVTHWTGGTLILDNGSLFNNQAAGLFSVECDCNLSQDSGSGTLANAGTFRKTIATGATIGSTGVPFNNSGTIDILSGTFESGLLTLNTGTIITGTGFRVNSGTVTVAGAASVASGQSMNITGGTLTGTSGSALTVNGTVNWTGGFLDGASGTVNIPSGGVLNINASGSQHLSGGYTINNSGVTHWTGGTLILDNGSLFNNQASGLFSVECDCTLAQDSGAGSFTNGGTVLKSLSTGTSIISAAVPFDNSSGTIDVKSGKLQFGNSFTQTAGSKLRFGIAGASPMSGYGQLSIANAFSFAGSTLEAYIVGGYIPPTAQSFAVMNFGSSSGAFGAKNLTFGSRSFSDSYTSTAFTLTADTLTCDTPPSGIVAWYRAEGNAVDSVGINNGSLSGGTTTSAGNVGQAFNFDGINDSVNVPMSSGLQLTTGVTLEFWMKGDPSNSLSTCCQGLVATDMYAIEVAGAGVHFGLSTDNGVTTPFPSSGQVAISTNQWHHIAGTYDGSTITLYVDGVPAASTAHTGPISANSGFLTIGSEDGRTGACPACVGTRYFKGLIDDVSIYNRALSGAEIAGIYNAGSSGKCFSAPAPTITGFTPSSGASGAAVVITGTNLIGASSVTFNGTPAVYTVDSSTQITATVAASATTGTIAVTTAGGTATSAGAFTVVTGTHWTNASGGNWNVGSNWSSGSVPTAADNTFIDAAGTYTVMLDVNPAFNSLTVGGGATGTQTLDLGSGHTTSFANPSAVSTRGVMIFSNGTMSGAAGLTINGTMNWSGDATINTPVTVASGATLNMTGTGTRIVDGVSLSNSGTVNWAPGNNISIYNSGSINNLSGGLFSITGDQLIYQSCCAAALQFSNAGTVRKTIGTGQTSFNGVPFNNTGTVDIQSGTFSPRGGTSTGVFNATGSATWLFDSGSYTIGSGGTLTGTGTYMINGAQLNVAASAVVVDHLTLTSGTLNLPSGGAISTSASGVVDWNGSATTTGTGTLAITSGGTINLSGAGTRIVDGITLNNGGTANWSGGNNLSIINSGVINNLAGALFYVTNDNLIYQHCCTPGQAFNNAGTFRKSTATGATSFSGIGFNNSGTVDIQSGTISPVSGTSSGNFNVAGSGTFLFGSGLYTLGPGATLTGSGNFLVNGAQLNVTGAGITVPHLTLSTGTLSMGSGVTLSTTATGVIDWNGSSTLGGPGSLDITGGGTINISGTGTRIVDGATLSNSGAANWSGGNNLSLTNSGVINNQSTGLFTVTNDQLVFYHCCAPGLAFNNAGTLRKNTATGTTTFGPIPLNNTGTVDIQSGTITARAGTSSSVFNVASAGTFLFDSGSYTLTSGASLTGSGKYQVDGGTLAINAAGVTVDHLILRTGAMSIGGSLSTTASGIIDWDGSASLTGSGSLSITNGGTLNLSGAGTRIVDTVTLNNSGTANWSAGNNISIINSGLVNNLASGLFNATGDQLVYNHCCVPGQAFNNAGTFRKSASTGTTTFNGIGFSNSGTIQARSGTLQINSYSSSGSPVYDFGIDSDANYGRLSFGGAFALSGSLIAAPINGYVPSGGRQFQIFTSPSISGAFSSKTLTFGSSPVRSFADSYTATAVVLTTSGPTITTLSPPTGSSSGGDPVTITGTGFVSGGSLAVTFGGAAATAVTFVNSTTITCTTPAHPAGVVDVVLTNGDGQPTTALSAYTYGNPPVVTAMRPTSGSTAGSGGVIFEGTSLNTVTSVSFGGVNGTILASSAGQLTVAAPPHAAGAVNVVVTNNVGSYTLTNGFTYVANDDAARDFFTSTNPSSRWSYGYEGSRGTTFNGYAVHNTNSGFDYWSTGGYPLLGRNSTSSTLQQVTNFTPSMKILLHPGGSGENSVIRWTAPANGSYRIHGYFVGLDSSFPTTTDVAVLQNNTTAQTLFSTNINSYNVPQNFDVTRSLGLGETIEFTVGFGSNGNYSGDATGLDVTIDPIAPTTADVGIVASASVTSVPTGGTFSYSTAVTNYGPAVANNVTVTVTLPANVTLSGSPTSSQGTCSGTTTITCNAGTMPVSGTATQTINVTASGAGTATASAAVTATEPDPNNANNANAANVLITGGSTLIVTTNADSGSGSLRQALADVSNTSVCPTPCSIAFNLPPAQLTITPLSALPAVTRANVLIDGTTQPGFAGTPLVTLDGSSALSATRGLQLSGGNDTVRSLSIVSFQGPAIAIDTAGADAIDGNYLGLRTNGTSAGPNAGDGILVTTAGNTIGGTIAASRNIISGNAGSGVVLKGTGANGNIVSGNYIGTNASGSGAVGNQTDGIQILFGASNNTVGGNTAGARNVISANVNAGVYIAGNSVGPLVCSGNTVAGNYIGTDTSGSTPLANANGLYLAAEVINSTIGGSAATSANTIVSASKGVTLTGPGNGNVILRNVISGNSGATIDLGNDGPTANDSGDPDSGANGLQNTPVFVDATLAGGTLTTHVNVDSSSVPTTGSLRVELFKSNASGAQALLWLGSQCFAGNALSGATITIASAPVVLGDKVVATATSYSDTACATVGDGTSELSATAASVSTCTPPAATITPGGPTTFCAGGSVNLTASAGASYQWRNFGTPIGGATAQVYNATTSGSYSVTVTNGAGCSATSSNTSVTVNTTVNVTISGGGPTTFCTGGSVTLTANPSGGSGTFASYQWLLNGSPIGGASSVSYSASAGGTYSVTVTDSAGCTGTSSTQAVTVNVPPSAAISAPASACPNSTVSASITSPVVGATYTWSVTNGTLQTGQGTSSITFSVATASPVTISVTATRNSCNASGSVSMSIGVFTPTITPAGPSSFCPGGNVVLTSSAATTYQWLLNGSPIGGANSQSYAASVAGNYAVTASNAGGCSGTSATVTVTQSAAPSPTVSAGGPTTFCSGGSVTLSTAAASSYQWLLNGAPVGGANSQTYAAAAGGNYSVTVTNASGCSATSGTVSVSVSPAPVVSISGPSSICGSGSVTLDAGAGFSSYNWSTGASTQTITVSPSSTTTYNVTVGNGSGCTGSASKTVTVSSGSSTTTVFAPASVPNGSEGNTASVAPAQAGSTYAWSITNGTITSGNGTPSIVWTAGASGNAIISILVTSGSCTGSGSATVPITDAADLALSATAAPNPVSSSGTVTFTLSVTNNGPNSAANVKVTSNLFGVSSPAASGSGWSCSTSSLTIVCTASSLPPGPAAPITITAAVSGANSAGDDAYITAGTADPNGTNNDAHAQTVIQTQPLCNNSAPATISPAQGAANVPNLVTFTWSASPNAISYDVWLASSNAAPAIVASTPSTSAMLSLPSGPSTWYVAAHFSGDCPTLFSAPRDFTVAASTNCVHDAPQLIAPSPSATISSPVTFNWTPVPQAIGYRLWLAIDGGAVQDAGTTNGATSLSVLLAGSTVAWHIDAIFPGCNPTSSAPSAFNLVNADACGNHGVPSLVSPPAGATLTSSIVDLQWTPTSGTSGYRVWAAANGAALVPIGTTAGATTLHATFSSGNIVWFVEALFNGCASSPSGQSSFTIPAAQNCNNSAATPLAPANDITLTNSEVDFNWSPSANAIGYELWLALNNGTPSPVGSTTGSTLRRTVGPGAVEWFVRAQFNGCEPVESAHARFTYAPPADCSLLRPILTAPADGAAAVFSPVDLRWSNVPGAMQYKVWLGKNGTPPVAIGTTPSTHLDQQPVPAGNATWFVEALFDHCPALQSTTSTFTAVPPPLPCATPGVPLPRAESTASTSVEYVIRWTPTGPSATTQYELQESSDAAFTAPLALTIDTSEWPFKHTNSGDSPVSYFYRVRAVGTCNGARSLFSLPLKVQVLPSNVTNPSSASGSTPADNPQTTHYEIHLGGSSTGNAKGVIAAATGDTFTVTTNQPWLTVSPSSGVVASGGTTLTVTAKTDGLPVGTSSGAVNVAFGAASGARGNIVALDTRPSSSTTVSVNLVQPVSPTAKTAPPPDALIIPAVAHADGINSKFQSDIRVTNSSAQPMKYQVTFVPTGDAGITQGKQTTVDIDPGRTLALDDVLQSWFGDSAATGTLEVRALTPTPASSSTSSSSSTGLPNILTFASSRTYNTTANGTFGQYIPAIPFGSFIGRGSDATKSAILSLQQIAQSSDYRTNLGIVEGSGDPASVLISVFAANGQKLTEFTQDLKGGQQVQLNSILAQKNVQVTDGRIEVKVVSPAGKVTAYASVLDNKTNDPLLVSPVTINQNAASRYVIPGVADLNNGFANWQTDVRLFNPSSTNVKATVTFYSQNGGTPQSKDLQLAPGQVQTLDGTLRNLFGITNDGGALHIATLSATPLVATARTYNQTANGTYGQFIPAVTANDAASLGSRPLQILQIEESDRYRSNVGFAEVTGKSATVEITAIPSDSKIVASTRIDLAPNQFIQYPQLLRSMGLGNNYNARVSVKVISGQGRVTAYASIIDMQTNDPTFVPAQ